MKIIEVMIELQVDPRDNIYIVALYVDKKAAVTVVAHPGPGLGSLAKS